MARWDRRYHEEFATDAVASARRELPRTHNCTPESAYAVIRANRDIARARAHLTSIGQQEGKRTHRLWGVVGKMERHVEQASDRLARCLLKERA